MDNLLKRTEELRERIEKTWSLLDIDGLISKNLELHQQMSASDFWQNQDQAVIISREAENLDDEIKSWQKMKKEVREFEEFLAIADQENDDSMSISLQAKYLELEKKFNDLEFQLLFSGSHDTNNAIVSIHAGTGGVDAQDWSEILERMYFRFAESKGWKTVIIDRLVGNEAGIKSVSFQVNGRFAYGYLRSEAGVHRLARISPFDGEALRQTSFAKVEVVPEMPEAMKVEMKDEDLRIDVFRSSGPGGQSVNTTDSAVRITHLPTGLVSTCQVERSQHQNKERALKILQNKLYQLEEDKKLFAEQKLKGILGKAEWGQQIRSYILYGNQLVKDHRTDYETSDVQAVLDGDLDKFIEAYLRLSLKR
jgi:peptide chain release factor 2